MSEEEAQTGPTDKFLSLFPPNALNRSDRSLRLHFFFFSSVDDISKTTFPINSRKLYLEFSNEISELLIFKKTKTHEVEFLSYNVPFL